MNEKNLFKKPKRRDATKLEDTWHNLTGQEEITKLIDISKLIPSDNPYPISDLENLIESIKQYGLEQNLVVQESEEADKYKIISGERRYQAINHILKNDEENEFEYLSQVYCKVINEEVDPILIRLRLHETNLQTRPLLKMSEKEKQAIIEDYMNLLNEARKQETLINGQPIKGKTRDLIAEHFNISSTQAGREISKIKNKGDQLDTPSEKEELPPQIKQYEGLQKKVKALAKAFEKATDIDQNQREELLSELQKIIHEN